VHFKMRRLASRRDQPFDDKPVAIWGLPERARHRRAQYHLRQSCVFLNACARAQGHDCGGAPKFDDTGTLTDRPSAV
jgi:hypothetical protein